MKPIFLGLCLGLGLFFLSVACLAREVTLFRYQVGAYPTEREALDKASEVRSATPGAVVHVETLSGTHPYKVRIGYFGTQQEAKKTSKVYQALYGPAFVVSVTKEDTAAQELGVTKPDDMDEVLRQTPNPADGMSAADLICNAAELVRSASGTEEITQRRALMEQAVSYLLELSAANPTSASAMWANKTLGNYYESLYYREQKKNALAGVTGMSATEEASVNSALAKYELVVSASPDTPEGEEAAYGVASMKWASAKAGLGGLNRPQALSAYEGFLEKYPDSKRAGRARMCAATLKFELVRGNKFLVQDAYAAMQSVLDASPTLTSQELGRVQLMLAEMQEFYLHDSRQAIVLASRIDLSPTQDKATASSALYIQAHAYRNLGKYAEAVPIYKRLLSEFDNTECFSLPLHPICLEAMGDCLMKLKDWDAAKEACTSLKQDWPQRLASGELRRNTGMDRERKEQGAMRKSGETICIIKKAFLCVMILLASHSFRQRRGLEHPYSTDSYPYLFRWMAGEETCIQYCVQSFCDGRPPARGDQSRGSDILR